MTHDYNDKEIQIIENFLNDSELKIGQLGRINPKTNKEEELTPLVKLYSIFLEDGRSLEELLAELQVQDSDIEEILNEVMGRK